MRAYTADMIPGGASPVINVSQYDNDYAVTVTLIEGAEIYTPPSGATIMVEGTKPDSNGFSYACTYQGNVVTMPIYTQMTAVAGRFPVELVVYQSGLRVGSCNITLAVERAPLDSDEIISDSDIPAIIALAQAQADAAASSAASAETAKTAAMDAAQDAIDAAQELQTAIQFNAALIHETASGAVASFADGADNIPMQSVVAEITPVQDLNGQANPYPPGGGKNLVNATVRDATTINGITSQVYDNNRVTISGTSTGPGDAVINVTPFTVPAGTAITFSMTSTGTRSLSLYVFLGSGATQIGNIAVGNKSITYTTTEELTTSSIRLRTFNGGTVSLDAQIQIEIGSTATAYAPYSNICPISGRTGLTVTRAGKNLMTLNSAASQSTVQGVTFTPQHNNGTMLINGTAANIAYKGFTYTGKSNALDATRYHGMTLTGAVVCDNEHVKGAWTYYKQDGSYVNLVSGNVKTATFTVPDEAIGFRFLIAIDEGTTLSNVEARLTLTLGTEPTYDPYLAQAYAVNWQTEAGTVYGGTLNVTTGVLTVTDVCIALTSSSTHWQKSTAYPGNFYIASSHVASDYNVPAIKNGTPFVCSHAKSVTRVQDLAYGCCFMDGSVNIRILQGSDTLADWLNYLNAQVTAGTPVQVCCQLATPQTYQLTPTEVRTLLGGNNIFTDAGSVTVEYVADIKLYIDKRIAELQALVLEN